MFTGGEPLLQLDAALIDAMHAEGFEIAVETNGTIAAPAGIETVAASQTPAESAQIPTDARSPAAAAGGAVAACRRMR